MNDRTMKENLQSFAVKKAIGYIGEDIDKGLPKLLAWADRFDRDGRYAGARNAIHKVVEDPNDN